MKIEPTRDFDLIRRVMTHPKVYPQIGDDASPPADLFTPCEHESFLYLAVRDAEAVLGLFLFVPQTSACLEVHTCLLPGAYGETAREAAMAAQRWIWRHTPVERIITHVPEHNRLALRFAKKAGMTEFGRNERSFRKGGVLHDQILLGLTRPEEIPPCRQH